MTYRIITRGYIENNNVKNQEQFVLVKFFSLERIFRVKISEKSTAIIKYVKDAHKRKLYSSLKEKLLMEGNFKLSSSIKKDRLVKNIFGKDIEGTIIGDIDSK